MKIQKSDGAPAKVNCGDGPFSVQYRLVKYSAFQFIELLYSSMQCSQEQHSCVGSHVCWHNFLLLQRSSIIQRFLCGERRKSYSIKEGLKTSKTLTGKLGFFLLFTSKKKYCP